MTCPDCEPLEREVTRLRDLLQLHARDWDQRCAQLARDLEAARAERDDYRAKWNRAVRIAVRRGKPGRVVT